MLPHLPSGSLAPLAGPMHGSLYIRRACPRSPLTRLHHTASSYRPPALRPSCASDRRGGTITNTNARRPFTSPTTGPPTSLAKTIRRVKSTWARSSASSTSHRGIYWCRPGCKWTRDDAEAEAIPRNKENVVSEGKQYELSDRELKWQKQIDSISTFIAKDPYKFLFGASDDRLRGIFPRIDWAQEMFPWKKAKTTDIEETKGGTRQEEKSASELHESNNTSNSKQKARHETNTFPPPVFVAPGELSFDPITMRMVRKPMAEPMTSSPAGPTLAKPSTVKHAVQRPGRRPIMSPSEYKQWSASRLQQNLPSCPADTVAIAVKPALEPAHAPAPVSASDPVATVISTAAETVVERPAWAKTALERSWALENKRAASAGRRSSPAEPVTAKTVLENSWKKENLVNSQDRIRPSSKAASIAPTMKTSTSKAQDKHTAFISTWLDIKNNGTVYPAARAALYNKHTPLTSMSYSDFRKHQATLIASWNAKAVPKASSVLEQKLQDEINTQKTAMTAFEDKWHLRDRPAQSPRAPISSRVPDAKMTADAVARKAQKNRDDALVQEIRGIYEGFYGPIGEAEPSIKAKPQREAQVGPEIADAVSSSIDQAGFATKAQPASVEGHRCASGSPRVRKILQDLKNAEKVAPEESMPETECLNMVKNKADETAEGNAFDACCVAKDSPRRADTTSAAAQTTGVDRATSPYGSLSAHSVPPNVARSHYRILAYDPSDNTVQTASASQTYTPPTGDKVLGLTDALTRLHAPAKFLPLLTKCQNHGYEIVSASGNLLILKREGFVEDAESLGQGGTTAVFKNSGLNPVDGTSAAPPEPATGNFASPTGFVNYDAIFAGASATRSQQSGRIVRKEEPVFSGASLRSSQDAREPITLASSFGRSSKSPNADELQYPAEQTSRSASALESIPPPPSPLPVSSSAEEHPSKDSTDEHRSMLRQAIIWAGGLVAACYAVGVVVEDLRQRGQSRYYENGPYARESSPLDRWRTGSATAASGSRESYWSSTQARRGFWGMETPAGEVMVWGALLAPLAMWWFVR